VPAGQRAKEALEPVGHNVVCDHPAHPWLEGGGANDQPVAEEKPINVTASRCVEVQHRFDRLLHSDSCQCANSSAAPGRASNRIVS